MFRHLFPRSAMAVMIAGAAASCFFTGAAHADPAYPDISRESTLPRGSKGLAAGFHGDRDIASHPEVLFADNFEQGEMLARWDDRAAAKGSPLSLAPAGGGVCGERCLKIEAKLGVNNGGGATKWFKPAPAVHVRFYCRFEADCDYIHHFVTLRANQSGTGGGKWSGFGGAGLKPAGDGRFSTALEPWGNWNKWPAPGRWNMYSYWHEMKPSPGDGKYWGNQFMPEPQDNIVKGRWICAEFMLRENTPGKPDGEQAFWIDGHLLGHWRGLNWRQSATLHANALTLESYVTDRWTQNPVNTVCFDNLVIARGYIGPAMP